jgi:hypothetical protein
MFTVAHQGSTAAWPNRRHEKAPKIRGFFPVSSLRSGNQSLARAIDHGLQRFGTGVLFRVQTFAVTGDTVLIDYGEAEATLASGHDQAIHRSESMSEGADGILSMDMSHVVMCSCIGHDLEP